VSARVTLATAGRVLWQIRRDPRTLALLLVVPVILLTLMYLVYENRPRTFQHIGAPMCGLFPFIIMFLVTSIAMLRERTSGTLERAAVLGLTRAAAHLRLRCPRARHQPTSARRSDGGGRLRHLRLHARRARAGGAHPAPPNGVVATVTAVRGAVAPQGQDAHGVVEVTIPLPQEAKKETVTITPHPDRRVTAEAGHLAV
jgi:hypothetical protein